VSKKIVSKIKCRTIVKIVFSNFGYVVFVTREQCWTRMDTFGYFWIRTKSTLDTIHYVFWDIGHETYVFGHETHVKYRGAFMCSTDPNQFGHVWTRATSGKCSKHVLNNSLYAMKIVICFIL
jgi:hypothetical protein